MLYCIIGYYWKNMSYITIEGIIGSGKSTLLSLLEQNPLFRTEYEPVHLWRNTQMEKDGEIVNINYLEQFYQNIRGNALQFQLVVANTLLDAQHKLLLDCEKETKFYVQDRSPMSGVKVFAPLTNIPFEYLYHLESLINKSKIKDPDIIVFLDCPIDIAQQRLRKRGRGEENGVSKEYQESLRENILKWIDEEEKKGTLVIRISNSITPEETYDYLLKKLF